MSYSSKNDTEITTAIGKEGLGKQSWWVEQWMELINSYRFKKRLERAWGYAREGNVTSIQFEGRRVHARVQGTEAEPYKVKLWLDILSDEDWKYVLEAMAKKARWSAQLLAGTMPEDIETAFAASGHRLFPFKLQEVKSECSCPDKANPCKHISAIYFLLGERFKEDPFILFQLRGRSRSRLLTDLAKERLKMLENLSIQKKDKTSNQNISKEEKPHQYHPSFSKPDLWWKYNTDLDQDLVIITPAMEGEEGLKVAGALPLAQEPQYPQSHSLFLENLIKHSQIQAHEAMIKAMSANS
ncbi:MULTISPECIES: SWIM zinc finger family protein [Prochlorococcus]|uniref:SWIM zinc finger family protein n=1 Tax=Prochlorococcus TaxID=1218 RepID=UPI000533927B|nr:MULTISPECIES: SWIM zinc finger family protein [Prochlorococcus]KGG13345.1 hypothetical protein EV05_1025 [Prochlorococcus sp. MIT 0601]